MESPPLRRERAPRNGAIDVWHEVPLVPQLTGMSCWAAAAAMVIGWRDRSALDVARVVQKSGKWDAYAEGLEPMDVPGLARQWGLHTVASRRHGVREFARLLEQSGPLWVGEASPGLHSVVVTGMHGDGTVGGTLVHVADPWPIGRGERYQVSFHDFMNNVQAAADLDGVDAQILHAGGRSARPLDAEESPEVRRLELDCPLLSSHGGPGPNLILRWNFADDVSAVDVVLHFHGYRDEHAAMRLPSVEVMSGLDLADPTAPADVAALRTRPTLTILPRGKWIGDGTHFSKKLQKTVPNDMRAYAFPAVTSREGALTDLVRFALDSVAAQTGRSDPGALERARLVLTAHSGGVAALERVLAWHDPDEVHVFDGLYSPSPNLSAWARRRILADAERLVELDVPEWEGAMREWGGALRVFYLFASPGYGTRDESLALHRVVACSRSVVAPPIASVLAQFYRVEGIASKTLEHNAMPPTLGWQLLQNAAANVTPQMTAPPEPSPSECRTIVRAQAALQGAKQETAMSNEYASHRPSEPDVARLLADRVLQHVGSDVRASLRKRPGDIDSIARAAAHAIREQVSGRPHAYGRPAPRGRPVARPLGWAADADSPDYSHIGAAFDGASFTLDASVLQTLCDNNAFDVSAETDVILFGLRGCSLVESSAAGVFASSVDLREDVPDHQTNHCVLGVWQVRGPDAGKVGVVRGSTVPTSKYMKAYAADPKNPDKFCNMLLTGKLPFAVGTHRANDAKRRLKGVFHETQWPVVVIRSRDDDVYTKTDFYEATNPGDNIHPSRFLNTEDFSSKGCQTIPGSGDADGNQFETRTPPGWVAFRTMAGLSPKRAPASENGRSFTYVLLTGREARLVAQAQASVTGMRRLRFGSSGASVSSLQTSLGVSVTGTMDAATTMAWIKAQQAANKGSADGIVTPADATARGFTL